MGAQVARIDPALDVSNVIKESVSTIATEFMYVLDEQSDQFQMYIELYRFNEFTLHLYQPFP